MPTFSTNHLMYGPGKPPSALNSRLVSSTSTVRCNVFAASLALAETICSDEPCNCGARSRSASRSCVRASVPHFVEIETDGVDVLGAQYLADFAQLVGIACSARALRNQKQTRPTTT